jgi:three-Cys-motif partner protein
MKLDQIGHWSEIKLEIIKKYAGAYTSIMKNQAWCKGYVYIDAFAGAGKHISRKTGQREKGTGTLSEDSQKRLRLWRGRGNMNNSIEKNYCASTEIRRLILSWPGRGITKRYKI